MNDARMHPRFHLDVRADVMGQEIALCCPLGDISLSGCRLLGSPTEPPGMDVELVLSFPSSGTHLPIRAVVVRTSEDDMSLKFQHATDEQKWILRKQLRDGRSGAA